MALFPDPGVELFNDTDQRIRQKMENFYHYAITMNQSFWAEADLDMRFEAGDQTVWDEVYGPDPMHNKRQFSFNRIRRIINMITGYQRRNRKSTVVTPVENGDNETADQFTRTIMWVHQQDSTLETISDAFHGALITGMNLLHIWLDYRNDPISGNIRVDKCSYNSFLIDPFFRNADLSDCNGIWKRSHISRRQALSLLPDCEEEIMQLNANTSGSYDDKFPYQPEAYQSYEYDILTYDEYYYRDFRTQTLIVDTNTGETQEWNGEKEQLDEFVNTYPELTTIEQEIPTVRMSILVQGHVMFDGPNPLGIDEYPFVPVLAFYRPELPYYQWRLQGVVRDLRDAQYLYNRQKIMQLDIMESQVGSGWKFKENALVDPKDAYMTGPGRSLMLKQESNMQDVEKIEPPYIPDSLFHLSQGLSQEIQEISGVNEELMGSAQDDKAGVLSMLRQGAGLTTLQSLFDQLDHAQRILGKRMISVVQNNFTPGKVKKILEEEPQPQFYNKAFGIYDAVVEQGINTATQKQMQFAQLLQLREYGVQIPDETLLEAATVQNKQDIINTIQQQQQQQQQQEQMQQELQQRQAEATIEATKAQAKESTGQGLERMSRVQENQALAGERQAREAAERAQAQEYAAQARENRMQAYENRYDGYLNLARAFKEMQGTDLDNLRKLIEVIDQLKAYEAYDDKDEQMTTMPNVEPSYAKASEDKPQQKRIGEQQDISSLLQQLGNN